MQEENQGGTEHKERAGSKFFTLGSLGSMLSANEQKSLLFYISIGIILVEFAVTVGALIYAIANAQQLPSGMMRFNFPWAGYLVSVVIAPVVVMLLVNLIGIGFYRAVHGDPVLDEEHIKDMPQRMRTIFSLVRGAPTVVLLGGILILGAVLYYLDGVMTFLLKLGDSVETIAIWATVGLVIAWCLSYFARMWFMYKTRRLEEEYAFRRDVLDRTGMIILDQKSMLGRDAPQLALGGLRELPAGSVEVLPSSTSGSAGAGNAPETGNASATAGVAATAAADQADGDVVDIEATAVPAASSEGAATEAAAANREATGANRPPHIDGAGDADTAQGKGNS